MNTKKIKSIAIHQPNFLPWIGFFYKWLQSDTFVLLDNVQFTKGGYTNRVKIKTPSGERWLTIPIKKKGKFGQKISEVKVHDEMDWKKRILGSIQAAYARSPYFKTYFPALEEIISQDQTRLVEYNVCLLEWAAGLLKIKVPFLRASQLSGIEGTATKRLISICQMLGAERYLSGFGGDKYQEEKAFQDNNIELVTSDFHHPLYPQQWGNFVPGLSIIDLLFNCCPEGKEILAQTMRD